MDLTTKTYMQSTLYSSINVNAYDQRRRFLFKMSSELLMSINGPQTMWGSLSLAKYKYVCFKNVYRT